MGRTEASLRRRTALGGLVALALVACSPGTDTYVVGADHWGPYDVAVESRPAPPRPGHNEVVVTVTGARRQPAYDLLVSVRAAQDQPWVQAIEDGHVGVYRRAVIFGPPGKTSIEVRLQHGSDDAVLQFPVSILASQNG